MIEDYLSIILYRQIYIWGGLQNNTSKIYFYYTYLEFLWLYGANKSLLLTPVLDVYLELVVNNKIDWNVKIHIL